MTQALLKSSQIQFQADQRALVKSVSSNNKELPKNKLDAIYQSLKESEAEFADAKNRASMGGAENQTSDQKSMQKIVDPFRGIQYHAFPNPLADYGVLCKQMSKNGMKTTTETAFIMSTLDSRRNIDRITDTTGDGYNMLSNQFSLIEQSEKSQKRASKRYKIQSIVVGGA